jgi:hypothetical protein
VEGAQGVHQKEKTQNNPDDLQGLAFDEHAYDIVDDVKDKRRNEERKEYGKHGSGMIFVGGIAPMLD